MSAGIPLNNSTVFAGLGTATFTVVTAGLYTVAVNSFLPYQASGSSNNSSVTSGGSSLSVAVNQNGSAKLTLSSPTPTQPTLSGTVHMSCAAADTITVVMSSAATADNQLNSVKTIINLFQGE